MQGSVAMEVHREELIYKPLWWQKLGLSQTSTGYGKKLCTPYMMNYRGRLKRVYCCCYSNSGTLYVVSNGREIEINVWG